MNLSVKKIENRSTFCKVMDNIIVDCFFFDSHSVRQRSAGASSQISNVFARLCSTVYLVVVHNCSKLHTGGVVCCLRLPCLGLFPIFTHAKTNSVTLASRVNFFASQAYDTILTVFARLRQPHKNRRAPTALVKPKTDIPVCILTI